MCVCDPQHYSLCCKNAWSLQCYILLSMLFSEDRTLAQFHLVVTHFQIFRSFILQRSKWSLWFLSKNSVCIWKANEMYSLVIYHFHVVLLFHKEYFKSVLRTLFHIYISVRKNCLFSLIYLLNMHLLCWNYLNSYIL